MDFRYIASVRREDYGNNTDTLVEDGADLVFTTGFGLADETARAARQYPDRHFVIMDYAFSPGNGCPRDIEDCYTDEGGLSNVTSIVFKEGQPAFRALTWQPMPWAWRPTMSGRAEFPRPARIWWPGQINGSW